MKVYKYGDNVDTDVIIPARYLNAPDEKSLASHCMEDIDTSFASTVEPGDIIVAGANFGCGSSREHAPLAIKACGVKCVIAPSFARIFYRNAINIGFPILECAEAAEGIQAGDTVSVDFSTGVITDETTGKTYQAAPLPAFVQGIVDNGERCGEMNYKIALIRGDGIGPEVVGEAVKVLEAVGQKFGHSFTYEEVLLGGCATDAVGKSYPDGTAEKCRACDAVLLGAVGGPKWGSDKPAEQRPETALLAIRKDLGLYANLRPAALRPAMADACPLKRETAEKGIDLMMVRELTGGIYFGQRERYDTPDRGVECADRMAYSEQEIERIGRRAFELASLRRKKVSSVDKANVLETSRLWRSVMHRLAEEYPDVQYEDVLVDNCAMQLVKDPGQFDVVVTENMFGDILSDEASMVTGSIGLLPSASIGDTAPGLYEPIHGSAPDIAGQDKANPIATILSVAMMFRYSFHLAAEADAVEAAVDAVLAEGWRTPDIAGPGVTPIGTQKMGELICRHIG